MIFAMLRLFGITLGVAFLAVTGVLGIRWMAAQQMFKAPPHPWFEQANWTIWQATPADFCDNQDLQKWAGDPNAIIALPIKRTDLETWTLPCESKIDIVEFLRLQPHQNWLFEFKITSAQGLDSLLTRMEEFKNQKNFGARSESQKVSLYLRKNAPHWLYAADSSTLLRFHLFAGIYLESALDFWPDFVILDSEDVQQWHTRQSTELARRMKRVIWHQLDGKAPPENFPTQGTMTTRSN